METEKEIHERMLANVDEEHDRTDGSFIFDATKPAAMEFARHQGEIIRVERKLDVNNLLGDELARFVYQHTGVRRKMATRAVTTVIITGTVGADVPKGTIVSTDSLDFEVEEDAKIGADGQVTVYVACVQYGSIGNVPANTITNFPVSIPGLVNVYNPNPVTSGYDAESDNQLRERYFDKLQRPGKAGNVYHYEEWASEVVGVGGVKVIPVWNGPLTVKVVIIDANKQPADEALVEQTLAHIEEERPFGAIVTVVSAKKLDIDIDVSLIISGAYDKETVEANLKENIDAYLQSIAFVTDYVSYARIGSIVIGTDGVLDYNDLKLNGGTKNVSVHDEEIAVLGAVTCTF